MSCTGLIPVSANSNVNINQEIEYRVLTPADRCHIITIANMEKRAGGLPPALGWIDFTVSDALNDGISSLALDCSSHKTVGFQLAVIVKPQDSLRLLDSDILSEDVRYTRSRESLFSRFGNVDLFQKYGVESLACLRGLYVVEEYRRRGIGTRLREHCLELICNQNIPLVVGYSNPKARAIFEKTEFQVVHDDFNELSRSADRTPYVKRLT